MNKTPIQESLERLKEELTYFDISSDTFQVLGRNWDEVEPLISKEIAQAEQRGREEAFNEIINEIPKSRIGSITYFELVKSILHLKKGNQTLDKI